MANREYFQIKELSNDQITSKITSYNQKINLEKITEIFIPEISRRTVDNIYVYGDVSDQGPFEISEYNLLSDLLNEINYTNEVYPYFGILENTSNTPYKNEYFAFSLEDKDSQSSLKLKPGSKIYLFSKDVFLRNNDYPKELNSAVQKIIDGHSVNFNGEF